MDFGFIKCLSNTSNTLSFVVGDQHTVEQEVSQKVLSVYLRGPPLCEDCVHVHAFPELHVLPGGKAEESQQNHNVAMHPNNDSGRCSLLPYYAAIVSMSYSTLYLHTQPLFPWPRVALLCLTPCIGPHERSRFFHTCRSDRHLASQTVTCYRPKNVDPKKNIFKVTQSHCMSACKDIRCWHHKKDSSCGHSLDRSYFYIWHLKKVFICKYYSDYNYNNST